MSCHGHGGGEGRKSGVYHVCHLGILHSQATGFSVLGWAWHGLEAHTWHAPLAHSGEEDARGVEQLGEEQH